jgi:predicted ATPase
VVPFQEIMLVPLAGDHSRVLIDNLVGDLPEVVRSQILRKTEDNPFFIEEVIRALIAEGTLAKETRDGAWRLARPVATLALPDTIQGVIMARIDRLEEGVKSVLKLASVIGRSFFLRILQAIAEAGDAVDRSLTQLEHAELIRLRERLPELEYIFKHALVQEAAYGSILVERRRAIHRSVAEATERLFADRLDEFTSLLAYHYALAEHWMTARSRSSSRLQRTTPSVTFGGGEGRPFASAGSSTTERTLPPQRSSPPTLCVWGRTREIRMSSPGD